jgi:hypothetical protein
MASKPINRKTNVVSESPQGDDDQCNSGNEGQQPADPHGAFHR